MEEVLIVDGYNIIGAWPALQQLKELNLESARDRLIDLLADYQAFSGKKVYLIFDAYKVPGLGGKYKQHQLEIRYTREKETADELIERLVNEMVKRRRHIQVATSDSVEQSLTFGLGGLRISARELLVEVQSAQKQIEGAIRRHEHRSRNVLNMKLSKEVKERLERWRRGK